MRQSSWDRSGKNGLCVIVKKIDGRSASLLSNGFQFKLIVDAALEKKTIEVCTQTLGGNTLFNWKKHRTAINWLCMVSNHPMWIYEHNKTYTKTSFYFKSEDDMIMILLAIA